MCLFPREIYNSTLNKNIKIKCNRCVECLKEQNQIWTLRIMLEASLYKKNSFITLTYDDDHLPSTKELSKRDLQLFFKRLRKSLGAEKIRYFACGEYGGTTGRPHYHLIVFNYEPDDLRLFKVEKGEKYYISDKLSKIWQNGYILVAGVNENTSRYVAKYMQKLNPFDWNAKQKSFVLSSRRPGIGFAALNDDWLKSDSIYIEGKRYNIPEYFIRKFKEFGFDDEIKLLKDNRIYKMEVQGDENFQKTIDLRRASARAFSRKVFRERKQEIAILDNIDNQFKKARDLRAKKILKNIRVGIDLSTYK